MPIATLYESAVTPQVALVGNLLSVGDYHWPLDDKGRVRIQIPRNRDFFAVMSFRDVFAAASAVPGEVEQAREIAASTVRGRMVYIGSSAAVLGDYAHVPIHGRTAGLGILALIHSALRNRHYRLQQFSFGSAANLRAACAICCRRAAHTVHIY